MNRSPDNAALESSAAKLKPRGSSQDGLRQYNERVILQAVRLHGPLPGAEIARLTGLTAQSISQITKRLLDEELLRKETPQRGKVGQPSVPLALNPDGALAIGIKIGRRSLDVLLVDFTGQVRGRWELQYALAKPAQVLAHIAASLEQIRASLPAALWPRIQGIGLAAPLNMGGWQELLGQDPSVAAQWRALALDEEVSKLTGLPVQSIKDTSAACVAELVAGRGRDVRNFVYVFVDTFIGGSLVLDSHLHLGRNGNAGAMGSLPLGQVTRGAQTQLLNVASLYQLENRYVAAGLDGTATSDGRSMSATYWPHTSLWLDECAPAIALALLNAACLLDLEAVIVDGCFCRELQQALLQAIQKAMHKMNWEGVTPPDLLAGAIGPHARALGGALLPLYANFAPDRDLFLKLNEG